MTKRTASLFGFPDPVNEVAARTVAAGVVVMAVLTLALGLPWLLVPLCYGFWARVLAGPSLSPLGQLATRVVARAWPARPTPGPPKRFAQGVGVATSSGAVLAWALAGWGLAAELLVGALAAAAFLEAAFGLCLGCRVYALLVRAHLVKDACETCGDLSLRHPELAEHRSA